jgi:hypothetical protein
MKQNNLEECFYTDSDVMVLTNLDNHIFNKTSYSKPSDQENYRWSYSGHTSYWKIEDLDKFCDFCIEIYKTKTDLIPKIEYHKTSGKLGGICDMTLLYLYGKDKDFDNICDINNNSCFDHQICSGDNVNRNEYEVFNGIKKLEKKDDNLYFKHKEHGSIKANSLHFQGGYKSYVNQIKNLLLNK